MGRNALGDLLTSYRGALLRHLTWKFQASSHQAEDWLQSFVEQKVLEYKLMQHADKARGRFRNFLLNAVDHFVWDEIAKDRAQKRRPTEGFALFEEAENKAVSSTSNAWVDPGDVAWARTVIERATNQTKKWYESQETPEAWQVFLLARVQPMLGTGERPSDQQIAQQCGIPSENVSNILTNVTRKFRTELRAVVSEYADSKDEVKEEFRCLIEVLKRAQ